MTILRRFSAQFNKRYLFLWLGSLYAVHVFDTLNLYQSSVYKYNPRKSLHDLGESKKAHFGSIKTAADQILKRSSLEEQDEDSEETFLNPAEEALKNLSEDELDAEEAALMTPEKHVQPPYSISDKYVFFSRISKTGGTAFSSLFGELAKRNGVRHFKSGEYIKRKLNTMAERKSMVDHFFKFKPMTVYNREIHFTNFTPFGKVQPKFFTILRDPVARFISRFGFIRQAINQFDFKIFHWLEPEAVKNNISKAEWKKRDLQNCIMTNNPECHFEQGTFRDFPIAYLCGHDDECQRFGSQEALQTAKENVEHYYQVVGALEEPVKTCELLEDQMPEFFTGCSELMAETWKVRNRGRKSYKLSEEAVNKLRENLAPEYDLYYFALRRMELQYRKIARRKQKEMDEP